MNQSALPETIDPDYQFVYIDISSVDSEGRWTASEPIVFADAPSRARRIVRDGDVLISTVRTYLRAIAYLPRIDQPIICSTGFAVLTGGPDVYPGFLAYWVRSSFFIDEIVARSVGVSYPAINASDIGNLPFPCIPINEQRAIAAFLDRETARIDELIKKKERQIELLEEKRTAIISHAVTKGLNPNVKMKNSGIEWLGEIPEHWEIKPVKYVGQFYTGWTPPTGRDEYFIGDNLWANISDLGPKILEDTAKRISNEAIKESRLKISPKGSLLFSFKLSIGQVSIAGADMYTNEAIATFPPDNGTDVAYLYWATPFYISHSADENIYGAKLLNQDLIKNTRMAVPPEDEQRAIAAFLDQETARIDELIEKIRKSVDLLCEYRTALITAAVTGKIDVREVDEGSLMNEQKLRDN